MSGYTDDVMLRHGVEGLRLVQKPFDAQTLLGVDPKRPGRLALEDRPVRDLGGALHVDAAAHGHVRAEAHVALDLQAVGLDQRGRAGGEARLEVAPGA